MSAAGEGGDVREVAIHEPRCNTECRPGLHHLTSGIGYPHIHRTDLTSQCGECVTPAADSGEGAP